MTTITEPNNRGLVATQATAKQTIQQDSRDPAFFHRPADHYRSWHQKSGPLWWEEFGFWCLKDFTSVDVALRDRRLKRLRPGPPGPEARPSCLAPEWPAHLRAFARTERHSLLALEGGAHTRLKRRAASAFSSRRIHNLEANIRSIANNAVDELAVRQTANLLTLWAERIPVTVIAELLGVPVAESDQLLAWSHAMVRVYTMTQTRAEEDAAEIAAAAFEARLQSLISERRDHPQDDLISDFCALNGEDSLSDEEIVSLVILLLNAGHEATVHQLGNAVVTLLEHRSTSFEHCFETPEKRDTLVQELGRFRTPLHLFTRYAQQDMEIGDGVCLQRGERLGLLLGAANHDPTRFNAPERFDPHRRNGATLGFGAGVHFCLGVHLAKLEIGIALDVLFKRLPMMTLAEPPVVSDTWHFHGLERLMIHPHGDG